MNHILLISESKSTNQKKRIYSSNTLNFKFRQIVSDDIVQILPIYIVLFIKSVSSRSISIFIKIIIGVYICSQRPVDYRLFTSLFHNWD